MAPDGEQYLGTWGKCNIVEAKDCFGFIPLRPSTNWFCQVGEGEGMIIIAGCHIHYAVKCSKPPVIKAGTYQHEVTKDQVVCNKIYLAE